MIFPLVGDDVLEYFFINGASTDVDSEIFPLVLDFKQLCDRIDVIAV